jgi:predicted GNAT family acetyltransferase
LDVTEAAPATDPEIAIRDNPDEDRYELLVDGELAGVADYRDRGGRRIFVHTEVDTAYAGRGLGNRLAQGVLDDALDRGLPIVARCPFIRAWLERHPEYMTRLVG